MHSVTDTQLHRASLKELEGHIEALEHDIGSFDFFFENFLTPMGPNEMGDHNTATPEWMLYRKMYDFYEDVDTQLRSAKFILSLG